MRVVPLVLCHALLLLLLLQQDPPAWLEQMVLIPQWRQLIYKLADKYPSCTMLNFAIKVCTAFPLSFSRTCTPDLHARQCGNTPFNSCVHVNRGFLTKDTQWRLQR